VSRLRAAFDALTLKQIVRASAAKGADEPMQLPNTTDLL
jgi:hypothetical protein